jgi:hypothetical protein
LALCFLGAAVTGALATRKLSQYLHIPFALVSFVILIIHTNTGLFLGIFFAAALSVVVFYLLAPLRKLEVDRRSIFGEQFIFLILKFNDSKYIRPGSFFNIAASSNSLLSFFHCHSFSVLSSQSSEVMFLIRRSTNRNSFTSRLALDKYQFYISTISPFNS